ncbi:hypothetical protein [Gymnodinialimonas hymeniacidonis]|uniref:hypothetical protein n=1 Tax=Gymnodinialimonas hymeniacidonis TaxID=3126508 RepID=UPI0034C66EEE
MGAPRPVSEALAELLNAQKVALLNGDIEGLSKIEAPLGRAFERLKKHPISDQALERIQKSARRNAVLLKAAQSGLNIARARVSDQMSAGLTVYDAKGRSQFTSSPASRLLARR